MSGTDRRCSWPRRSATPGSSCCAEHFEVELGAGWSREELAERIGEFDGILIRSATKLDAELIGRADRLRAVGRAGVGVDNVDVAAATKRGIVVANAPAVERHHRGRAHAGAAAGAGAQHPPGPRLADRGQVGALEVLRRRAVREDARDPRLRPDRPARRPAGARASGCGSSPMTRTSAPSATGSSASRRPRRSDEVYAAADFLTAAPAQDARDRGLARRRGAGEVQGRRPDPQRRPRAAGRRRGPAGGDRQRQGRRRRARRVPLGADHRASAVRLPERDRHAAPRRLHRRGHRPGRLPGRRAGGRGAHRRRGHDRGQPARDPGRRTSRCSGRSCRSAARSGRSRWRSPRARRSTRSATEFLGRIGDRDTRLLTIEVLLGVLRGHTEEEVGVVNAPAMAAERGIAMSETKSSRRARLHRPDSRHRAQRRSAGAGGRAR